MGYRTYTAKVGTFELQFKIKKEQASSMAYSLKELYRLPSYCRETSNHGTHETVVLFGPSGVPLRNPETYPADVDAFLGGLVGTVITLENWPAINEQRKALKELHIPLKDTRQSAEEVAAQQAETARLIAEREAKEREKRAAIVAEWGEGKTITVPIDHTAIVLQQTYDASEPMTDYFERHRSHGPAFLLGMVPGRARQTEALARLMVARYPLDLGTVDSFTWHTETYSMGHGNYLMSAPGVGSAIDPSDPHSGKCAFEVQFEYNAQRAQTFEAWIGYPGTAAALPTEATDTPEASNGTPRLNPSKGGVEIRFAAKPPQATLDGLKAHGWRWSRFGSCWYAKDSATSRAFATELTGLSLPDFNPPDRFDMHVEDCMAEAAGVR